MNIGQKAAIAVATGITLGVVSLSVPASAGSHAVKHFDCARIANVNDRNINGQVREIERESADGQNVTVDLKVLHQQIAQGTFRDPSAAIRACLARQ